MMPKRFQTPLGDSGLRMTEEGAVLNTGNLRPFAGTYSFLNSRWAITVWARDLADARHYAREHQLTIEGEIHTVIEP